MRDVVRRALRPIVAVVKACTRPVSSRLRARVVFWARQGTDDRFVNLEHQMGEVRADIAGLERYMPALLNAIASQNAMNRANVRSEAEIGRLVGAVLERFEAALAEQRAGRGGADLGALVEPKVLHPERLTPDDGVLRLNLASGHEIVPGFVNVDVQPFDEVDVVADPRNLPFEPGSVAELRAVHLLERYPTRELEETVLPHWIAVLAPGAPLVALVRDADALVRGYVAGEVDFETLREATFGAGAPGEPALLSMFSRDSAVALFERVGLREVSVRRATGTARGSDLEISGCAPARPRP
jgi:hypothetical protein